MAVDSLESESEGLEGANWDGLAPEVVSKTWNQSARDVRKRSRQCYAYIKDFCKDIQNLNLMIASTKIMEMVNGLHTRNKMAPNFGKSTLHNRKASYRAYFEGKCYLEEATRNLEASKRKIQEVLGGRWKYLNLDMECLSMEIFPLRDTLLLKEVISACSDSLQKLVMGQIDDRRYIPSGEIQFGKLK